MELSENLPTPWFKDGLHIRISIASLTTRRPHVGSTAVVLACLGSNCRPHCSQCSAKGELSVLPCLRSAACSLSLTFLGRPVSPTYVAPHSHEVLYTTPFLSSLGTASFAFTSLSRRVGLELCPTRMLCGAKIRPILSLEPFTYGTLMYMARCRSAVG